MNTIWKWVDENCEKNKSFFLLKWMNFFLKRLKMIKIEYDKFYYIPTLVKMFSYWLVIFVGQKRKNR